MTITADLIRLALRRAPGGRGRMQLERLARHLGVRDEDEKSDRELVETVTARMARVRRAG